MLAGGRLVRARRKGNNCEVCVGLRAHVYKAEDSGWVANVVRTELGGEEPNCGSSYINLFRVANTVGFSELTKLCNYQPS